MTSQATRHAGASHFSRSYTGEGQTRQFKLTSMFVGKEIDDMLHRPKLHISSSQKNPALDCSKAALNILG